jgi:hypothetical protein
MKLQKMENRIQKRKEQMKKSIEFKDILMKLFRN